MKYLLSLLILVAVVASVPAVLWLVQNEPPPPPGAGVDFAGSGECRECHMEFYEKWSTSWHGLAMQEYTPEFARTQLVPQVEDVVVGDRTYRAEIGDSGGLLREISPQGEKTYPISFAMGGKNVYFFLTPWHGGRLQVLPLAFDARKKEWYDTTGSMVRHFRGEERDEPLHWTERPFTFNASCFTCHVSQLSKNYDLETDSYNTTWGETGINCESCHGPAEEHVKIFNELAKDPLLPEPATDELGVIVTGSFSVPQTNTMCGVCHAKMVPLTTSYQPSELFFDHFNLVTLEDRDFYPDGRDLGENFTYTLWLISPCVRSGELSCMHCHTSSGRNRHAGADADKACLPCHETHVSDPAAHSFHAADSEGSRCVACHMPRTTFARMRRHDHTLLPPTPAATMRFQSPNACNICHDDKDAAWADRWVRKWYPRDYQEPLLKRAELIEAARKGDWKRLDEMVAYIGNPKRNEVFASSLLRLLENCPSPAKWPAFLGAMEDPSPLVRSSAAHGLDSCPDPRASDALVRAAADPFRVVRVRAGAALTSYPKEGFDSNQMVMVGKALDEYESMLRCQPDQPHSYYNLGLYYQDQGDLRRALSEYETSVRLDPSFIPAHVNASLAHARLGDSAAAERSLRRALRVDRDSAEANFNLGLLLAELNKLAEAERCLRRALKADPNFAEAAYNLAVLVAEKNLNETVLLCRKAAKLRPEDPKYAYTLAFYLHQAGRAEAAVDVLKPLVSGHPTRVDAVALLGRIYEESGEPALALDLYHGALESSMLPESARAEFTARIATLQNW